MKRRSFLAVGVAAAGTAATVSVPTAGGEPTNGRLTLELRRYSFASEGKRQAFEGFCESGLVPALQRAGVHLVGVFRMIRADNPQATFPSEISPELFVLIPHTSPGLMAELDTKLATDRDYQAATVRLGETAKDPAYLRYESWLLAAFEGWPRVETPVKSPNRVLQMRTYESATAERGRMKVRMFNEGLIHVIRDVGITPVFFGQAFAGPQLPCMTYMIAWENAAAMGAGWGRFAQHPGWQRMSTDPSYADTVSRITNRVLRPVAGSQI